MEEIVEDILHQHPHLRYWFPDRLLEIFQSEDIPARLMEASTHIESLHQRTPIIPYGKIELDDYDLILWLKLDTLNSGNSFKDRGSAYAIHRGMQQGLLQPGDEVVTASAGNHALGVIKAANDNGLEATVFMAKSTPERKIQRAKSMTPGVVLEGESYHDAAEAALEYVLETGSSYIPAYQHPDIILGQSTILTEAVQQLQELGAFPHFFTFPVGGGGLSTGAAIAAHHHSALHKRKMLVFGVQTLNYSSMAESLRGGTPIESNYSDGTIADGIQVTKASPEMLELSLRYLDGMVTLGEDQIKAAIKEVYFAESIRHYQGLTPEELLACHARFGFHPNHLQNGNLERMHILEGAAATSIASVLTGAVNIDEIYETNNFRPSSRPNIHGVVIASGNNIDADVLQEVVSSDYSVRMHPVSYDLQHYRI
tara:strand:+ start:11376 stop:12653 length:1278 start_codon:yes stop_codon:yes gene_type:complete